MVARGTKTPKRLDPDAILEALLEVRFEAPTILPEVLFGRLTENAAWKEWQQRRMPTYEIPAPLRDANPTLRFTPIFELVSPQTDRAVRIGPRVMSYHVKAPYPGWEAFRGELDDAVGELLSKAKGATIVRLGLRYINALTYDRHFVRSAADLALKIQVSDDLQTDELNLNFKVRFSDDTVCTVRVATRDFVQGALPETAAVMVDVDVATTDPFMTQDGSVVRDWAEFAHEKGKQEFFHLLTPEIIEKLEVH